MAHACICDGCGKAAPTVGDPWESQGHAVPEGWARVALERQGVSFRQNTRHVCSADCAHAALAALWIEQEPAYTDTADLRPKLGVFGVEREPA